MNEDKSSRYHRYRRWTEVLALVARLLVLGSFIGLGFSPWLVALGRSLTELGRLPSLLVVSLLIAVHALCISIACDLVALPWLAYSRFWLERRYRRTQMSLGGWLWGYGRGVLLHAAVWVGCALAAYAAIRQWPVTWWLVTGVTFAVGAIVLTHLGPVVIFPWLYELKPLDRPRLQARLDALTRRVGTPLAAIQEWRLGLETGRPNAALVGIGSTRRVLLSDGLLADYSEDEIEVVLAHELAHHVNYDIWKTIVYETSVVVVACLAADAVVGQVGPAVGISGVQDVGGLPLLVGVGGAVVTILAPVRNAMSRRHERQADQYALELTQNPAALISSLRRLGEQNLTEQRPSRLVEWFFYTHPPVADRLAAARAARKH